MARLRTHQMKKILPLLLIGLLPGCGWSSNGLPAPAASLRAPLKVRAVSGQVQQVIGVDPAGGTASRIVIVTSGGRRINFVVKPTTTIYDSTWQAATLSGIKLRQPVKVEYTLNDDGLAEARSIKPARL